MYGMEENYEPDEILRDADAFDEVLYEDEFQELSFETGREAQEGFFLLNNGVDSPEEMY